MNNDGCDILFWHPWPLAKKASLTRVNRGFFPKSSVTPSRATEHNPKALPTPVHAQDVKSVNSIDRS